ncbi:MAG: S8 family serine peptidase, partial [Fidelibacterota bacterium]
MMATLILAGSAMGKIDQATWELGARSNGQIHAWVFINHQYSGSAEEREPQQISSRAKRRRARRGVLDKRQIQELDRLVSPDLLQRVIETGADIRHVSRWMKAISVKATSAQLKTIAKLPFVSRIEPVRQLSTPPLPDNQNDIRVASSANRKSTPLDYGPSLGQLQLMNVPAVHELGYSGRGVIILMLDTGFYQEHESIWPGRILAEYDFLEGDDETQNQTVEEDRVGQHRHGTYTYTALGGYKPGYLIGPAFQCNFLLAKTESVPGEYPAEEDNYVAGLEWGEALGADIVSSSLGYLDWYTYDSLDGMTAVTTRAVRWATRLGMLVVTAAGNERNSLDWGGYIIAPADADSIIAVGAVDADGNIASFSSHGPTFDGRIKPEVVAQG